MMSCLAHEMLTPLKCIDQLAQRIKNSRETSNQNRHIIDVMSQTIKLLNAQITENMDRSLINANQFKTREGSHELLTEVIKPIIDLF
jgi:signal transduction histidine kinase